MDTIIDLLCFAFARLKLWVQEITEDWQRHDVTVEAMERSVIAFSHPY